MGSSGFMLCFYPSRSSARDAFRQLRRWRSRRTALVHKSAEGILRVKRIRPRLFTQVSLYLGIFFTLSTIYAVHKADLGNPATIFLVFISLTLAGTLAALASPILSRFPFMGIDKEMFGKYTQCLVSGESVLVVQASPAMMSGAISVLRRVSKDQPTIFAFHPKRDLLLAELRRNDAEPIPPSRFRDYARSLASGHTTTTGAGKETPLLKHLDACEKILEEVHQILVDASHLEQAISTSAEWILDNSFIVHNHISDVRKNLPKRFYRELPILEGGPYRGQPRIYAIASELVFHAEGQLDRHIIKDFLDAYQTVSHLTTGELWTFPLMLRISLVENLCRLSEKFDRLLREGEAADFWANRLIVATRNEPDLLFTILTELTREIHEPSVNFGMQLVEHLYDEESALKPVQGWLERKLGDNLESIFPREKALQSKNEASIGNTFTSLRWLKQVDWRNHFENQSHVERVLRKDPAGIYPHMDFTTRDSYRHAVESISKAGGGSEESVARAVISLAKQHFNNEKTDLRRSHVGYYLVDSGRKELTERLQSVDNRRHRTLAMVYDKHALIYFSSLTLTTLILLLPLWISLPTGFPLVMTLLLTSLAVLPASQISIQLINFAVTHILSPRQLPKMNFKKGGIPEAFLTLVVVPTMLTGKSQIRSDIENLEIRYQANSDPNLFFALFVDFTDAPQPGMKSDEEFLGEAVKGIQRLNDRCGLDRFYLFNRDREWSDSESCYMGWERKRGKLEDLNRFLNRVPHRTGQEIVKVGSPDRLSRVRYVIILDSDTQLPPGSARRMVETIAHPLNQPVIDPESGLVKKGYTIIQPRISTSLPSSTATGFSRLFNDPVGTDPYSMAVSDVYQDLSGEVSFIGKGIYDPGVFHRVLTGRFPERSILSHDLIEGSYVRAGLASDIELLDDFPSNYIAYSVREHRWIRGDWQIADRLLPWVTDGHGRKVRNPLSIFNRWKIFDNMRRSLVTPASLLLIIISWYQPVGPGIAASLLVGVNLFSSLFIDLLSWFLAPVRLMALMPSQIFRNLKRSLITASLMVHQACLVTDAIIRVFYRRLISHRGMLQWNTAQAVQVSKGTEKAKRLIYCLIPVSALSALAAVYAGLFYQPSRFAVYPYLFLWFLSPFMIWRFGLDRTARTPELSQEDRIFLRRIARRTWRTFDDLVGHKTNWLPADNYQVSHTDKLARRTSPTNIGLYLLSILAAGDFGYLSPADAVMRINNTLGTMERLQLYEGHLLNWYDLDSLKPLRPMYVSTVDSGNLIGCLWALNQGLQEMIDSPLLGPQVPRGIVDTASVLKDVMMDSNMKSSCLTMVEDLIRDAEHVQGSITPDIVKWLHRSVIQAQIIQTALEKELSAESLEMVDANGADNSNSAREVQYWADQLFRQSRNWSKVADRYLSWLEELPSSITGSAGFLNNFTSLRHLADEDHPFARKVQEDLQTPGGTDKDNEMRSSLLESMNASAWMASDLLEEVAQAIQRIREMTDRINMRFLYNTRKRIFHIGFNVSDQRHDTSFYDLLASEARLASFIAIARGEVPVEHWMALGRPYGSLGRRKVLLSWGGTMFEYLMPQLLLKEYQNSLLTAANREAIDLQIDFGRRQGVPWGISESAYADLDASRVYQYRSFGVPGLGLKRGLEEDLVVSPYASIMALPYRPLDVVSNLRHLQSMGLLGGFGFYESIDFTRQRTKGRAGVVVRTFMAHHQGMAFLSLDNFLNGNLVQKRFHKDVRVRATEPLLFERIPTLSPVYEVPTEERAPSSATPVEITPSESKFDTPHTETPKIQILSNGSYSTLITNSGGGYSRWKGVELTRWRADTTRDNRGLFCYIKDLESGRLWSNCYQPVRGKMDNYVVSFSLDRAEIRRSDSGVETETEVIVSPEDDAEIRRITLINRSGITKEFQVTTYAEPVLADHRADIIHPAFNKIFVRTELDEEGPYLLATRRRRSEEEPEVWIGHQLTAEIHTDTPVQWETDRNRFLGRGRSPADPQAMYEDLSGTTGMVLDPVLAMRRTVTVKPGQRATLYLTLCAAENREQVVLILKKYREPGNIKRERDLTWRQAQLELRHLRIQPEEARQYQYLASYMIYPSDRLRPPEKRLKQNVHGQSRFWPYGISGDLPIMAVNIGPGHDIGLVAQALQAHTYWRRHGLETDLLILNEEAYSYDQPLHNLLFRLVRNYAPYSGMDSPGGVYLRFVDQIPGEDLTFMLASARVVLVAARGHLAQQMGGATLKRQLPRKITATASAIKELPSAMPHLELQWDNGTGGFSKDGSEYIIDLDDESITPAPWVNIISNPDFGTLVSESGSGFTWYGNSQRNRLTTWSNDPVSDPSSEAIYVRDEMTGDFWSPARLPAGGKGPRRVHHGQGYTVFLHNTHGLDQELVVFVPVSEGLQDPIKVQRLRIRNTSERTRHLSVTYYAEWVLGEDRERSQMHVVTNWDPQSRAMMAVNPYNEDYGDRITFAFAGPVPDSCTGDREEFIGRNGSLNAPAAMGRVGLSGRTGAGFDPCSAIQVMLELEPGGSEDIVCLLGQAGSRDEVRKLIRRYGNTEGVQNVLEKTKEWWYHRLSRVSVTTPETEVNVLLNRWLPYQTLSCRLWARTGFYQSGGAYGYRDQLQDVLSLLHMEPSLARDHILAAASKQFREGDVLHWWHPPSGSGIRSRCSDDLLWLPFAVSQYVAFTDDIGILNEYIPFIEGDPLGDEDEVFMIPTQSLEQGTLYEHCQRAVSHGLTEGPHGLPLIGIGDWNDGMNGVGVAGKGESVWLAWFLKVVLEGMADLADRLAQTEDAKEFLEKAGELMSAVEDHAWDGEWYRRAFYDDGSPLGSISGDEARIDSIAQSWSVISQGGNTERAKKAMESAWSHLVMEDEKLTLLLSPPFDHGTSHPGYIKGYPPGVRENGGQYSHAAIWLAKAFAMLGDGRRAAQILAMVNPINHTLSKECVERYKTEPYAVAADIYRLKENIGRGGWTWYTGAAGWLYRVWVEDILGLKVGGDLLRIDPVIPPEWDKLRVQYRRGKTLYNINIENPDNMGKGVAWIKMDDRLLEDGTIPLAPVSTTREIQHNIIVRMGPIPQLG